jgi:hypothetical protein
MNRRRHRPAPENDEQLALSGVAAIPKPGDGERAWSDLDDAPIGRAPYTLLAIECGAERGLGVVGEAITKSSELSCASAQPAECAEEGLRVWLLRHWIGLRTSGGDANPCGGRSRLRALDVFGRWPFLPVDDIEFHELAFIEGLVAVPLDRGMMYETILLTVGAGDEAEPFRLVEPLHGTGRSHILNS